MIKNKYKSDYKASARMDGRGRIVEDYSYVGNYYYLPLDEAKKKKANLMNVLFGMSMLLLTIAAGLMNADSSRTAWIVFPYLFLFLPCAYMLFGAHSFWGAKIRMEKVVYDTTITRMRRSCWGVIILSAVNSILDIVYIFLNFSDMNKIREFSYLVCMAVLLAVGIAFGKYFDKTYMPVTVENC